MIELPDGHKVFMPRKDGGVIEMTAELYKRACGLKLGLPSVSWSDEDREEFIRDPDAFEKKLRPETR